MKVIYKLSYSAILLFIILSLSGCKKDSDPPKLATVEVTDITYVSAKSGGEIRDAGSAPVTSRGVCWSTSSKPTISDSYTSDGSGNGDFVSEIDGLTPGTTYYVRAYARNSAGVGYGNEEVFTTDSLAVATLSTSEASDITHNSATAGGEITDNGGTDITARGICWSTSVNPSITNNTVAGGSGSGAFTANITGLNPGTTYYVRAYATNESGTAYGNQVSFNTEESVTPTLTTTEVTEITANSAISGGNITDNGGTAITMRGVCWSLSKNPTTADSRTENGAATGAFTSSLAGLDPDTVYYVRAYATNAAGTGYGNQVSFHTSPAEMASVTTLEISEVSFTSAVAGGDIADDKGDAITARGVCWSTSANPTTEDNKTTDGTGTGSFTSSITGLTPGTTYYVRAYAKNSRGTAYGNQVTFETATASVPTITTALISDITATSASSGGNVTEDGGSTVTLRGVCWSTSENPTLDDNVSENGSGTGEFTSNLTGLTHGTTYYVRAYATNSAGTAYGDQESFTTADMLVATLTTIEPHDLTSTTASSGGEITDNGGGAITARGVCWSTSELPTLDDNFTVDADGDGMFASNITGLEDGTVYYVRAYATNSEGTGYGNQIEFITPVTDIEGNVYSTIRIGDQVWMAENLKTTKYTDNTDIPYVTGNSEWDALTTPAYCWLNNNPANKDVYGALYTWYTLNTGNLCPAGWHEPTLSEYNALQVELGLPVSEVNTWGFRGTDQGTQLKDTDTWTVGAGTNTTGFSALAGGYRQWDGGFFVTAGEITYFWSATNDAANGHPEVAWYIRLDSDPRVFVATTRIHGGKYVRCLKD